MKSFHCPYASIYHTTECWQMRTEFIKTPLLKNSFSKISLHVTDRWLLLLNYLHSCNTQEAQLTCSIPLWDTVCMQYKQNYPKNLGIALISFWVLGNTIFCRISTVNSRAWRNTSLQGKLHEPKQKEILFCIDVSVYVHTKIISSTHINKEHYSRIFMKFYKIWNAMQKNR